MKKNTSAPEGAPKSRGRDKGAAAVKKAMKPVQKNPMPSAEGAAPTSNVVVMNAGGPAAVAVVQTDPAAVLEAASVKWAAAKAAEGIGKKEADKLRKEMLPLIDVKVGFKNESVDAKPSTDVDYDDPKLVTVLKELGIWDQVKKEVADADLVKSVALTNPEVQAVIDEIKKPGLKFFQVKDTSDKG